jgi:hypothetical protein
LTKQHLDLRVDAAKLVGCPSGQRIVHVGIDAQQDAFTRLAHV